jgi:hypothetical protein
MSGFAFSQTNSYKFKINNVTTLAEAKDITDPLRDKFKTYPTFKDATDHFEFESEVNMTQSGLISLLALYNYTLTEFIKSNSSTTTKDDLKQ